MRMSKERLRAEIKTIRLSKKLSLKRFIALYGTTIHVSHHSVLSRLESGDRAISVKVLTGFVEAFPGDLTAAIQRHLNWLTPVIDSDDRKIRIERQVDGSFIVTENLTTTLDLNYYLVCHCRGRQVEQELRRRLPSLYGVTVWPTDAVLKTAVSERLNASPVTCFIDGDDANRQEIQLSLQPLELSDVADLGGEVDGLSSDDVLFYGQALDDYPGKKTLVSDSVAHRRPTLREWHWIATFPYKRIMHSVRMSAPDGQDLGGFNVHSFTPDAVVARQATSNSSTVTLRASSPISPGHGWIATWLNPPA